MLYAHPLMPVVQSEENTAIYPSRSPSGLAMSRGYERFGRSPL